MALPGELEYAGKYYAEDLNRKFHGKPFLDREVSAVYVYRKEVDEKKLHLQKEEVESVRWLDYHTCLSLVRQGDQRFCADVQDLEILGAYLGVPEEEE